MTANGSRRRGAWIVAALLLTLLVVFSPTILFGEALSSLGLIGLGIIGLFAGLLLRVRGRGGPRSYGSLLAIAGGLLLLAGIVLAALALGGWGRPY